MAEELVNPERLKRAHRLIWIRFWRDAEGKRLQVEATVTERHLEVVAKGPKLIFSTEEVESPLVETFPVEKLASGEVLGVFDAEDRILEYVRTHTHANASLLAGEMTRNVRGFIEDEMPYLAAHFFYRSLDICSFREIYRRWKVAKTQKFECHIDELRFYKNEMVQKRGVEHHCYEKADRIIWIDCEMTGLELDTHHIVEIACIVTNADLQIVDHLDNIVIHQTPDAMRLMSDWCRKVFKKNGLTQRIIDSMITKEEAEARVLEFLSGHVPPGVCPLAGNSIPTDRRFIEKDMPKLAKFLGPSDLDVTPVANIIKNPNSSRSLRECFSYGRAHRALNDIRQSITSLQRMDTLTNDQVDWLLSTLPHLCLARVNIASTSNPLWNDLVQKYLDREALDIGFKIPSDKNGMYFYALKGPISNKKFQPTNLRKWTNLEERGNFYLTNFSISGRANPLEPPPDHERCDPENALRFARLLAYDMRGTEMKMYFFDRENEEFVGKLVSCLNTQFKTVKILTMSGLGRHLETYVRRLVEAGCVKKLRVEMCEITQGFLDQMKLLFVQSQIEHIKINCSIKPEAEFFIEMVEFWKATPLPHCKYVITSKMAEFAVEDGEMIWTQLCSKYGAPVEEKLITIEHVGEIRSLRIKKAFRSELITLQVVRCWKTLKEGKGPKLKRKKSWSDMVEFHRERGEVL